MALRFSISLLWETVAALRVLSAPDYSPAHQRWIAWAEPRLTALGPDMSVLQELTALPVVPEYLIPTPAIRMMTIEDELFHLPRVWTPERIAAAGPPWLREAALPAVQERLRAVHAAIIKPLWPRLEGVLQGDLERRGRRLLEAGAPTVLDELHPDVSPAGPEAVVVNKTRVEIGDRDLVLVPSAFVWPNVYLRDSPVRLALCYPAHGFGTLWERAEAPPEALAKLLGATRARLLQELERPSTVSELAQRVGVTIGAVSQHLTVLRAAGLAVSRREGRDVVSLRTALGLALVRGEIIQ